MACLYLEEATFVAKRLGGPCSCREHSSRPWPTSIVRPSSIKPAPLQIQNFLRKYKPEADRCESNRITYADPSVEEAVDNLSKNIEELEKLVSAVQANQPCGDIETLEEGEQTARRMHTMRNFLRSGGNMPVDIEAPTTCRAAELGSAIGGFLVYKADRNIYRAIYILMGVSKGQVLLQKLPALTSRDPSEIRRLARSSSSSNGLYVADPARVQRYLRVITPRTLIEQSAIAIPGGLQAMLAQA